MLENYNFLGNPNPKIQELRQLIANCIEEYLRLFKADYRGKKPNYFHSWAVIYKREKLRETPHIHHYNPINISGVYYVGGNFQPGNGDLEFYNKLKSRRPEAHYSPNEGKLLLFPATLPHGIGYYDGASPRLSIAFDVWFQKTNFACNVI
jgi:hypothetical protein